MQEQFLKNINKRNTQLRFNLLWFIKNVGIINDYKKDILIQNRKKIKYIDNNKSYFDVIDNLKKFSKSPLMFYDKIDFYLKKILNVELNLEQVDKLKKDLLLSDIENEKQLKVKRDIFIKELCRIMKPNLCSGCYKKHNIKNRSFKHIKTGNFYFEIHHNIPFANGKEFDVLENLVKLCPVCHKMLKKGIAEPIKQKELIKNIINASFNNDIKEFAIYVFKTNNIDQLINSIFEKLK